MKRRALLGSGAALTVFFATGCAIPVIPKRPAPDAAAGLAWIRHEAGSYLLNLPRAEMGQEVSTALKQVACEELGIEWEQLRVQQIDTTRLSRVAATVGSESIQKYALPLARACATLRDALAAGAAGGRLKAEDRPVSSLRAFRNPGRHVGRTPRAESALALVRGEALFASDVRRPGQLFGRVLRSPSPTDLPSRALALDEPAARAVRGFVALIRDPALRMGSSEGIGVVARTPGALDAVAAALSPRWSEPVAFNHTAIDDAIDVDRRLSARGRLAHRVHDDRIRIEEPWDIDLRIDIPLAAHGSIEPRVAVAEWSADGACDLWVGHQDAFYVRDVVARHVGLDAEQVRVHGCRIGGSFGGKTICTVELEAAVLAREVGAPVKVQWTRQQELQHAFHRPPSSHRVRARVREGRIVEWWHAFGSSHILFTGAVLPAWLQRVTDLIGDDGVARGARLAYRAGARRTEFDLARLPVMTGPWRGLGAGPNGLVIESAIDECAHRMALDPLQFRIDNVESPRLIGTLKAVAQAAAWQGPQARAGGGRLTARGVACGTYKAASHAAVIAEVEVDEATGSIRVVGLWCAHDCGRVVNPGIVRAQCEGNLVWGIGMVLFDRLPVAGSRVAAQTFFDAPIPRLADVPPLHVTLIDSDEAPGGAGETAIVASAAAIANAVRSATGMRPTRFPIGRPDMSGGTQRSEGEATISELRALRA